MIDVKAAKQETLRGDKDVIYYVEGDSPNVTSYAKNLRGLQVRGDAQAVILDKNRFSFITTSIPDPHMMTMTQTRFNSINKDRQRQRERLGQTGASFGVTTDFDMQRATTAEKGHRRGHSMPMD